MNCQFFSVNQICSKGELNNLCRIFTYGYRLKCFTVRELIASCDKTLFNSASKQQSHCLNQLFQY